MTEPSPRYLFCVGAQKSGTTWLHDYFMGHPDVHVPENKEMHYFSSRHGAECWPIVNRRIKNLTGALKRRINRGPAQDPTQQANADRVMHLIRMHLDPDPTHPVYREVMTTGWQGQPLVADISPTYAMIGTEGYRDMLRFEPTAKFLFIMRDPLDRLISSLRMFYNDPRPDGAVSDQLTFEDMCRAYLNGAMPHIRRRSDYTETLDALTQVVPVEQLKVILFENMLSPEGVADVCNFAGISQTPAEFGKVVRKGKSQKLGDELMGQLEETVAPIRHAVRERFGIDTSAWRQPEPVQ